MTRLSIPPEARKLPKDDHSTTMTHDLCKAKVLIGVSVRESQTLIVMSPEADTILEESKLNFTFKIASE
jgi:hypothetical protein